MSQVTSREISGTTQRTGQALRDWVSACRVHQWAKNLLIFVPLILGHILHDPVALLRSIGAFLAFCPLASATYIINDLWDLEADRRHPSKRLRPFAAGRLPVAQGIIVSALFLAAGGLGGFLLSPTVALVMAAYLALTLAYSAWLKRIAMLDVATIGVLFTLRIILGISLNHLPMSPWLLAFSGCLFLSLALAKRHAEVMKAGARGEIEVEGRGYQGADWPLTLGFGLATGCGSIIIMMLFITQEASTNGAYGAAGWLYVAPVCVFLWIMRIWLLSNRMELHDDPVIFALKDPPSYGLGAIVVLAFMLAL